MDFDYIKSQFEEYATDAGIEISNSLLNKISKRAKELLEQEEPEEDETFDVTDIFSELVEFIPDKHSNSEEWEDFINECSSFIDDER